MTDYFVRVSFDGDLVGAFARRRGPAGKARDCMIKAAPPEMNGAHFADEARAKFFEDLVDLHQRLPESIRVFSIVRLVNLILIKANRILNLNRHRPNPYVHP